MTSEARPRQRRIVNPEYLDHALRAIVDAWQRRCEPDLHNAIEDAQRLLGMTKRDPVEVR